MGDSLFNYKARHADIHDLLHRTSVCIGPGSLLLLSWSMLYSTREPSFVHEKLKIPLFNLINLIFIAIAKLPNFPFLPFFCLSVSPPFVVHRIDSLLTLHFARENRKSRAMGCCGRNSWTRGEKNSIPELRYKTPFTSPSVDNDLWQRRREKRNRNIYVISFVTCDVKR